MKNIDIIDAVKDDAYEIALKEQNTYPSTIIAMCIIRYKKKYTSDNDILNNNPFGLINAITYEKLVYASMYEGLLAGIKDDFVYTTITQDEIANIKDILSLHIYDLAYLKTCDRVIVDLTDKEDDPFMDHYTIQKNGKIVTTVYTYKEAEEMYRKDNSIQIKNSRGKLINMKPTENTINGIKIATNDITAGTKLVCTKVNLYKDSTSKKPLRLLNGVYYISTGKEENGMYRVCQKRMVGNNDIVTELGYVKATDITK